MVEKKARKLSYCCGSAAEWEPAAVEPRVGKEDQGKLFLVK
jgi:hypothetical protein